ncbi:MAG: hypothetical protein ACRD0U_06025, partial [Acidimicrobiales bacterium]
MIDRDGLVDAIRVAASQGDAQQAVRDVLERLVAEPASLAAALDSGDRTCYERLYADPTLTILNLVLPPGLASPIHDHGMWAVVGIYGGMESNSFYRRSGEGVEASGGREIATGEVLMMGASTIHAVENTQDTYLGAVHVYGGDLFSTPRSRFSVDGGEQPYDEVGIESGARALAAIEADLGRGLRGDEVRPL